MRATIAEQFAAFRAALYLLESEFEELCLATEEQTEVELDEPTLVGIYETLEAMGVHVNNAESVLLKKEK